MRIPSGVTDQYIYFVAVDLTNFTTRETGLSSFTVYRSRDGAAAALMTPTINETDSTNMPGVYELLLDEDMTIGAGNDTEEMSFHITQASMAPVTRTIELYRPKITVGETLTVGSGIASADVTEISTSATAANNLELMYDGTGYTDATGPSSRTQVDGIGSSSGGSLNFANDSDNIDGAIIGGITFDGVESSGTNASVNSENAVWHQITHSANNIDIVYRFPVGTFRSAAELTWKGRLVGTNDTMTIQAWNGSGWDTVASILGQSNSAPSDTGDNATESIPLLSSHTGTGAELGNVYIRLECAAQSSPVLYTDQLIVSAVSTATSVGYAGGAYWVDSAGTSGVVIGSNGTADNPCPYADALTMNSSQPLNRFSIANGNTVTLSANSDAFHFSGRNWILALGGQSIEGTSFDGATSITGTGTATVTTTSFIDCKFAGATIPPSRLDRCGVGLASGTLTFGSKGDFDLHDCFSLVPGSAAPVFVCSGLGASTNIGNRAWTGGADYTLDGDCTLSHEVLAGGKTKVTSAGADVEIRGITRELELVMNGTETIQFVGTTGPIGLSGTTTATVKLYGVAGVLADTTSAATVTNDTVSQENINTEVDTGISDAALATQAKLLAYTQLMSRSDNAINTDNSAELTEINADGGSGAGDYDNTGEALEALRDTLALEASLLATSDLDTALTDIHLDHLFAAAYDATSKPGNAAALLNELVEDDGAGITQYTVNALENGPSGSGSSPATIAAEVWDTLQASHVAAGTFGIIASEIAAIPTTAMRGTDSAYTGTPPTAAAITDAVWDEAQVDHTTADTMGAMATEIALIPTTAMRGTDGAVTTKTGMILDSTGLDSVVVETGLNARQALSISASSGSGVLAGAATTTVTIAAAGVPATNRITATVDADGNRSSVTLAPPA